ncbi:MAG: hypothetical protein P8H03_10130 [Emcibacteraceae bacterium]|nr:hypothetical protein [Emcibacteraceae bacterium]MDG1859199.1 hypothetical protein [Emcibacteraceae bacterium]
MVKLITTSVVRGSQQGESHGGVYILDIEKQDVRQVIDWNKADIDWQGRGWDRGLRGIAIDGETIYIVASDELFAYTPDFKMIGSWKNPHLKHAHEMSIHERSLFIASTGFDSILSFDLDKKAFHWALHVDLDGFRFKADVYDPNGDDGPLALNKLHINNVHANENGMYMSGLKSGGMLHFNGEEVNMSATLPQGTHNAQPFRDGVLFNDSKSNAVRYASRSGEEDRAFDVPMYDKADLEQHGVDDSKVARQGFGRGLCMINDRIVAAGSSPSTISIYDLKDSKTLLSVNLSMDIRNAIHGLEIWPF